MMCYHCNTFFDDWSTAIIICDGPKHNPSWPQELASFDNYRDIKWCYNFFMHLSSDISINEKEVALQNMFIHYKNIGSSVEINNSNFLFDYDVVVGLKKGNIIDLDWIDRNDKRLLNWLVLSGLYLLSTIQSAVNLGYFGVISVYSYPFILTNMMPSVEEQYDFIIEYIDSIRFAYTDASYKRSQLNVIKEFWSKVKTPISDVKWLEQNNEEQLSWAWNYLTDHSVAAKVPPPANTKEYYNAILASLDMMNNFNRFNNRFNESTAEKQKFITQFKKAWSQKKFRAAGKTKKPYHLPLTIKAKESLEELALLKNCTESEVLEGLIQREYVQIVLDAQGRKKY